MSKSGKELTHRQEWGGSCPEGCGEERAVWELIYNDGSNEVFCEACGIQREISGSKETIFEKSESCAVHQVKKNYVEDLQEKA